MANEPTALEQRALSLMRARFDAQRHYPSKEQFEALSDIIMCMEDMRTERSSNHVFLSPIDPGIGKTSALSAYLSVYLGSCAGAPPEERQGILICINSWREIEDLLCTIRPHLSQVYVRVPKGRTFGDQQMRESYSMRNSQHPENCNSVISASELAADSNSAEVFIATHEYISRTIERYGSKQTATPLYYAGRPREVAVWDEAWVPAEPITISCRQLTEVLLCVSHLSNSAYQVLFAFINEAQMRKDGERMLFPDLGTMGITYETVDSYFDRSQSLLSSREVERKSVLLYRCIMASGKHVSVCNEQGYGNTVLTFTDSSPYAMAPLLVLDASGRVRKLYCDLVSRGVVKLLRTAAKDFSNLKVHLWPRPAGKKTYNSAIATDYLEVADEVVKLVQSKPSEQFLILHFKAKDHPTHPVVDFAGVVTEKLQDTQCDRVKFLTWGKHRATNEFADFENIVVFGLLNLPRATLAALQRIGMGIRPEDGEVASVADFRLGEHKHNLLQALCRIRVRKAQGAGCPPASAYIIAHPNSGIRSLLKDVFPGIGDVETWGKHSEDNHALTPLQTETLEYLRRCVVLKPECFPKRFSRVMRSVGVTDGSHFKRAVRSSIEFNTALDLIGIREDRSTSCNATSWCIFDWDRLPQPIARDFDFSTG